MSLFVMNFICIIIFGFSTFRFVKKVSPQEVDQQKFIRTNNGSMYSKRDMLEHEDGSVFRSSTQKKDFSKPLVENSHHGGSSVATGSSSSVSKASLSKLTRKSIMKDSGNAGSNDTSYTPPQISGNQPIVATSTTSPMYDENKTL